MAPKNQSFDFFVYLFKNQLRLLLRAATPAATPATPVAVEAARGRRLMGIVAEV